MIEVAELAPDVRLRLIKLAGQLTAEQENIRALAALKCTELLRANGSTWEEALSPAPLPVPSPAPPSAPPIPRSWRAVAEEILVFHANALRITGSYDEPSFLNDLCARGRAPTFKQAKWLADIACRCGIALWDDYIP